MSNAPSIVTWLVKDSGTFRELVDGGFQRLPDAFPVITGADWKRVTDGPIATNAVAEGIRQHFTGPATTGAQPAKQAAEGAPKGNSGDRGAGESLPYAAVSATSAATAAGQPRPAQRAAAGRQAQGHARGIAGAAGGHFQSVTDHCWDYSI